MSGENTVTLVGNITRDAELRFTNAGRACATFGIAVNRRWQNKDTQEWEERVSYFNVATWDTLAENCVESFPKGTRVIVTGMLQQRSWETEAGEKKSVVEVIASEVGASARWATMQVSRNERQGAKKVENEAPEYGDDEPF